MIDKKLLKLVPETMRHVIATVIWKWIGLIANVALCFAVAQLLAALGEKDSLEALAFSSLILIAFALVARVLSIRRASQESFTASQDIKQTLRTRIYKKLLALGPRYTEQISTAEVVQLSVDGTEQLETYFGQYLPQLFYAVAAPLSLFLIVAPLSLLCAVVLLVFVPLIPLVIVAIQKLAKRILSKYWDQYAKLGDSFLENLQGLTTLKIYDADAMRHKAMNAEAEHFRIVTMKVLSMQLNSIIVMDIVALGGAVAGIAVALGQLSSETLDLSTTFFIILVSSEFFIPMRQLGSYFHIAMNGLAAADKIFKLLALPEPPARKLALPEPPARKLAPAAHDALLLRHVSFSYTPDNKTIEDVSLEVAPIGLTALVGESGSGKSTIAALVTGQLFNYKGEALIGSTQVRNFNPDALMRQITTITTRSHLFRGTVRENLLIAKPDASDKQLWEGLARAQIDNFSHTQEGLETMLDEDAKNLSGGQRQRLALARALLHDSPIYIFDEATSNIDMESEEAIMAVITSLAQKHAVLLISHRLANVIYADRIYVLADGHVVGSGTHKELLANCSTYCRFWKGQREVERYAHMGREASHEQQ